MNIYDFKMTNNKGEEVDFNKYRGKVLLVVNTATGCGFTPQYKGLQEMYDKYKNEGFEILDFPCNSFLFQAPGSDEKIDGFCTLKYNTTFERFTKSKVNGKDANDVYKYLTSKESGFPGKIKWNFTKFLIDREGKVVNRFKPSMKPEKFEEEVSKLVLNK
ncbi:MAG: glutathione peroxidase [Acholeplasmatales bacterium]|nr:glutathione peroxidase [Acholeplasmatales bacterium]